MGDNGVLVGVGGCLEVGPPSADVCQLRAAVRATPQINPTDKDEVRVCRIPRPDDVVVPPLPAKVQRTVITKNERLTAVVGAPYLPAVSIDPRVDDFRVLHCVGKLNTARPSLFGAGRCPRLAPVLGKGCCAID